MKLIKASYKIITPINGEEILRQIEIAARTCYKSEDKIEYIMNAHGSPSFTASSARILITKLIKNGHEAMLEFGGMITVKFICDRGVSHELVRHRLCSFAQESTRFCNYGNNEHIQFIIPCWFSGYNEGIYTEKDYEDFSQQDGTYQWYSTLITAKNNYKNLIKLGWSPQQARLVLPNSLKTEINISANIREWRHILKLRTAKAAHPQMRELMCPLLDEFKSKIPILFDDITY